MATSKPAKAPRPGKAPATGAPKAPRPGKAPPAKAPATRRTGGK